MLRQRHDGCRTISVFATLEGDIIVTDAVERLLNLALYLAAAQGPRSAEDVRAEVTGYAPDQDDDAFKRQFERDKDDLRSSGFVILTDAENEGFYRLDRAATYASNVDLTPQETAAVRAAASALLDDPSFPFAEDLRLAVAKIASALDVNDIPSIARLADEDPERQGTAAALIADAGSRCKVIDFDYTNSRGIRAPHRVEPYGLFLHDGRWYLVGRDTAKDEVRTYTVARIAGLSVNGSRPKSPDFERPPGFDVREFVRLPFQYGAPGDEFDATLTFSPELAWRARMLAGNQGDFRPATAGSTTWNVRARSGPGLARFVVEIGPGLTIQSPPRLAEQLCSGLEEVARLHG